jgi:hypothetical protein
MGEPVWMARLKDGIPLEFTWRGRRHRVRSAELSRQPALPLGRRSSRGAQPRRYRLQTAEGLRCEVSEDPRRGLWTMEKVFSAREVLRESRDALV